jgi:SpoVK/Ycf46/Vps4 family AAA+-type ATPase
MMHRAAVLLQQARRAEEAQIAPRPAAPDDSEATPEGGEHETPVMVGRNGRPAEQRAARNPVGIIVNPTAHNSFENLVAPMSVIGDIRAGIRLIRQLPELERIFGISRIEPMTGRCLLNFWGPSGTGKTKAALAVAHELGVPLLQVDYASIVSKYLGDTAKHIRRAFREASEAGAVMFFDEADSLLSRRLDTGESWATTMNQNRNVLMQELDRFNGVVICTTNLFRNYDPAIVSRIAKHVEFKLPTETERAQILKLHLPVMENVDANLAEVAARMDGFSGRDIKSVCVNSILAAASGSVLPEQWRVTTTIMLLEVDKLRAAQEAHASQRRRTPAAQSTPAAN